MRARVCHHNNYLYENNVPLKTNECETISINVFTFIYLFFFQTLGMEQKFDYASPLTAFGQVSLLHKWIQ
jgi:hypothetical protein